MTDDVRWIAVGWITRAHGVKGEVAVALLTQVPERFDAGSTLFLGESEHRSVTIKTSRPHHNRVLISFDDVKDRNAAELLRGQYLFVSADDAPELGENEFWPHQLLGCAVTYEDGRTVGEVVEVVEGPANDLWIARGTEGSPEVLIPALKDVVVSVDVVGRKVVIRDIPGLTSP